MLKRVSLLHFMLALLAAKVLGQSAASKIIPPPPNAASLGIYGQVPISLYTGLPNISIPLYTIQYRDITLPISISYYAQGVKVDQEASWIGLNWSLNAGGVITRTTRGYDDIITNLNKVGYPFVDFTKTGIKPDVDEPLNPYDQHHSDYEPDLFYFNFAGKAGKFILDRATVDADNKVIVKGISLSAEKLSIVYHTGAGPEVSNPYPGYWEIITADGYTYKFDEKEFTFTRRSKGASNQFDGSVGADFSCLNGISTGSSEDNAVHALFDYETETVNPGRESKQVGAWQLSRITSPTGAFIEFEYYRNVNYASLSPLLRMESSGPLVEPTSGNSANAYCYTSQLITKDRLLKEIRFGEGRVLFKTEGRDDVQTLKADVDPAALTRYNITPGSPQRLKQIQVVHPQSSFQKLFDFKYGYFNEGKSSDFLRLKLTELVENGQKRHQFHYDERKALPSKNSFDKDHWGYYNGEWNNYGKAGTLLPTMIYQPDEVSPFIIVGASRKGSPCRRRPDRGILVDLQTGEKDYPYMEAGVLTKIVYPTGGYTILEYEPNQYLHKQIWEQNSYIRSDDDSWEEKIISLLNGQESEVFEVHQPTFFKMIIEGSGVRLNSYPAMPDLVSIIPIDNPNADPINFSMTTNCYPTYQDFIKSCPNCGQDQSSYEYNCSRFRWTSNGYDRPLPPGKYKMVVKNHYSSATTNNALLYVTATMGYMDFDPGTLRIGGGLRIKRIIDSDGINAANDQVKNYTYTTTQYGAETSTGRLMSNAVKYCFPVDFINHTNTQKRGYSVRSNTTYPLSSAAQGSSIGYSKVTVHYGNGNGKGKEEHLFYNEPEQLRPGTPKNQCKYVPDLYNPVYVENGFAYHEVYSEWYQNAFRPVKEVVRNYESKTIKTFTGYRFWQTWIAYANHSQWVDYTDEVVRNYSYDAQGNSHIMTSLSKTYHENQEHFLPTRTERTNSKGEIITTRTSYPADYNDVDAGPVVREMKTGKHLHSLPIQQTVTRKGADGAEKVISSHFTHYDFSPAGSGVIKPVGVYQLQAERPLLYNNAFEFPRYSPYTWNHDSEAWPNNTPGAFRRQISYQYDAKGNLRQYQAEDGTVVTVLWGYESQFPIAEIKNAAYAAVETALGGPDAVKNLADSHVLSTDQLSQVSGLQGQLTEAMVSVYAYDPLKGMTSQSDPNGVKLHYEYDDMGRLQIVKDGEQKTLQQYQYHYKPY